MPKYVKIILWCVCWTLPVLAQPMPDAIPLLPLTPELRVGLRLGTEATVTRSFQSSIHPEATQGRYAWIVPYLGTDGEHLRGASVDTYGRMAEVVAPPNVCEDLFGYAYGHSDGAATAQPDPLLLLTGDEIFNALSEYQVSYSAAYAEALREYVEAGYHFQFMIIEKDLENYPFEVFINYESIRYSLDDEYTPTLPFGLLRFHFDEPYETRVVISGDATTTPQFTLADYPITDTNLDDSYRWKPHPLNHRGLGEPTINAYTYFDEAMLANPNTAIRRYAGLDADDTTYLTTFSALQSPEQATDWTLIPAPYKLDFTAIDLTNRDPILLHGCSTETADTPYAEIADNLPDERSFLPYRHLSATAFHPAGWVVSPIFNAEDEHPVAYAISPEAVTEQTLLDFATNEDTPPMLLVMPSFIAFVVDPTVDEQLSSLPAERTTHAPYPTINGLGGSTFPWEESGFGIRAYLIMDDDEYAAAPQTYDAMLRHFETYRYWLHPQLEHTVYLQFGDNEQYLWMNVGYPQGMIPRIDIANRKSVTLYNANGAPQIIIENAGFDGIYGRATDDQGNTLTGEAALRAVYGLTDASFAYMAAEGIDNLCFTEADQLIPIRREGRDGYLTLRGDVHLIYRAEGATVSEALVEAVASSISRNNTVNCV